MNIIRLFKTIVAITDKYHVLNTVDTCWDCKHFYKTDGYCDACFRNKGDYFDPMCVKEEPNDKCRTCKYAFTTGKERLYCKKSLANKDDCGEYEEESEEKEE